jgi:hypothetical protein
LSASIPVPTFGFGGLYLDIALGAPIPYIKPTKTCGEPRGTPGKYTHVDFSTSMLVYPRLPLVGGFLPCWLHDFSNPQNPPGPSTKSKAELDTFFFIK